MTHMDGWTLKVLLVGEDAALLEGLAQSFAAQGYLPRVVGSLHEAREASTSFAPLLAIVERDLASYASSDALAITLAPGGALILYNGSGAERSAIAPTLQRTVLAELTLPLERNRLLALTQHVHDRVLATGRTNRRTPPEQRAL
jgi:DNA-binding NtrC family response regulator